MNQWCTTKLSDEDRADDNTSLGNATLKHFKPCTKDQLKAFIHVRHFDTAKATLKWPSKKGTIKDAEDGNDCFLLRAFNSRLMECRITDDLASDLMPSAATSVDANSSVVTL